MTKKKQKLEKRRAAPDLQWRPKGEDEPVLVRNMEGSHLANAFRLLAAKAIESAQIDIDPFAGKILPRLSPGARDYLTEMAKEMRWRGYFEAGRQWRVPMTKAPVLWTEAAVRIAGEAVQISAAAMAMAATSWAFDWTHGRIGGAHKTSSTLTMKPPTPASVYAKAVKDGDKVKPASKVVYPTIHSKKQAGFIVSKEIAESAIKALKNNLTLAKMIDNYYATEAQADAYLKQQQEAAAMTQILIGDDEFEQEQGIEPDTSNYCDSCGRLITSNSGECLRQACLLKRLKAAETKPLLEGAGPGHAIRKPIKPLIRKRRIRLED